jgi:hypothetical protein
MKIFLLEDSMKRVLRFRRAFHAHSLTHLASAAEAIGLLAHEGFDIICLDHDLTEHDTDWIADGTGLEVAQFLGSHDTPNNEATIVIHSMNPEGCERMMAALQSRRVYRISIIELFSAAALESLLTKK